MSRPILAMPKFLLTASLLLLLVSSGCFWRAKSEEPRQDPNTVSEVPPVPDTSSALAEGTHFLDTGEIDKAIDTLREAVRLDPGLAEAWFKLGIAYALAEKRDDVLEKTDDANESNTESTKKNVKPNSVKAFEKAVAAYKKIIGANPEDHAAHFNLGRAYNKLNEDEDAAKALKQAVKLQPEDTEYQTELGAILIKLAQYHEAIPPLKKALELDPDNLRAMELLEDAEAGRSRINYASTPKEEKKKPGASSTSNSNSAPPPPASNKATNPPGPRPTPAQPRPSPKQP